MIVGFNAVSSVAVGERECERAAEGESYIAAVPYSLRLAQGPSYSLTLSLSHLLRTGPTIRSCLAADRRSARFCEPPRNGEGIEGRSLTPEEPVARTSPPATAPRKLPAAPGTWVGCRWYENSLAPGASHPRRSAYRRRDRACR